MVKGNPFDADDKPYQEAEGSAPYFQKRMLSRSGRNSHSYQRNKNSGMGQKRLKTDNSHDHLNDFIQNQIAHKQGREAKSQSSRRNHELIEAAA